MQESQQDGRKLRVAILLLNAGRGSGEVARQHARHLVGTGHTVHFMHPAVGECVEGAINKDIPLHSPVTPVHEHLPSAGENQKQVARMSFEEATAYVADYARALEEVAGEVDLFFGHHANLSAVATAQVAREVGKPYVLFLHGTGIEPRHQGGYNDRVWDQIQDAIEEADGILVTTEYVRDELVRNLIDLPLDCFLVLPCGIDLEEFRPGQGREIAAGFGLPETYVICPGDLVHSRGPRNVVAASREYSSLAPTIFIGDGELRAEIEAGIADRGRLLGCVSSAERAALINAATLLVAAPEKKERCGISYAEALAAGTPPVAYEGGGASSIVTPETGLLTSRQPAELGRAVRTLLEDPARRKAMATAGRARAEQHFEPSMLGRRLEKWLLNLSTDS